MYLYLLPMGSPVLENYWPIPWCYYGTNRDKQAGFACSAGSWLLLRFVAATAPSGAFAASLLDPRRNAADRRRLALSSCPAGPGICQAHHL